MSDITTYYRKSRALGVRASDALDAAREAVRVDALWEAANVDWGHALTFTWDDMPGVALKITTDDMPYDWGDLEPTEHERDSLEVYVIAVETDDGDVLDAVGGVGILPGETCYGRSTERELLALASWNGFIGRMRDETREREHWAARDVVTV